jgi:chorismate--pyruvate lyase
MSHAPIWHPATRLAHLKLSPDLRTWLLAADSMTKRLNTAKQQELSVHCLQQAWQVPFRSETKRLGFSLYKQAVLREVELLFGEDIWIYARSVIPAATLTGKNQWLKKLGTRSLGSVLFRDPLLRRSEFEIAILNPSHQEYQLAVRHVPLKQLPQGELLARRSIFYINHKPLLLTEVFLPVCTNTLTHHAKKL